MFLNIPAANLAICHISHPGSPSLLTGPLSAVPPPPEMAALCHIPCLCGKLLVTLTLHSSGVQFPGQHLGPGQGRDLGDRSAPLQPLWVSRHGAGSGTGRLRKACSEDLSTRRPGLCPGALLADGWRVRSPLAPEPPAHILGVSGPFCSSRGGASSDYIYRSIASSQPCQQA